MTLCKSVLLRVLRNTCLVQYSLLVGPGGHCPIQKLGAVVCPEDFDWGLLEVSGLVCPTYQVEWDLRFLCHRACPCLSGVVVYYG